MLLKGSCHCGEVQFSVQSRTPRPYMLCYCSICRKIAGGGGYAINIMGIADSMQVEGEAHLSLYQVRGEDGALSENRRYFCSKCGTALWAANRNYAAFVYPFASAIDTPLPIPNVRVHIMETYRPDWVAVAANKGDDHFPEYPSEGIYDWHEQQGLLEPE